MSKIVLDDKFKQIFSKNRKCIVNADIDGIIAGMLLQRFLNWRVVGYSSCCGKPDDELWLEDKKENLVDCVFVDLPVSVPELSVIDQHFISIDSESIDRYNSENNKLNPNVMRNRMFVNANGNCEYTNKYPFGTAHFVLAVLENLNIIDEQVSLLIHKKIDSFELADLFLRADRVIGNTYQYTPNCLDWANWMIDLGGKNTEALFVVVKNEYKTRINAEKKVEQCLINFGCKGIDGDCSNLFRVKDYTKLVEYFGFLSEAFEMRPLPIFKIFDFNKLNGKRVFISNSDISVAKAESKRRDMFSFAFVTMKAMSLTYIEEER